METFIESVPGTNQHSPLTKPPQLAVLARQSLIAEAELTPKPGLVDRRGSGSHNDLTLDRLRRSAYILEPYFAEMAFLAAKPPMTASLRREVAAIGRNAEAEMLQEAGGSNTHRGSIWILGLLVCAVSQCTQTQAEPICRSAGLLARIPDPHQQRTESHGDLVRRRYGATGARGEACADFPHLTGVALPALRRSRAQGKTEQQCRLITLLELMARLDDTCILYRGGIDGMRRVHKGAAEVLQAGGPDTPKGHRAMQSLDRTLLRHKLSPGGSADLLAATLFLDAVEHGRTDIDEDRSSWGNEYGTD